MNKDIRYIYKNVLIYNYKIYINADDFYDVYIVKDSGVTVYLSTMPLPRRRL